MGNQLSSQEESIMIDEQRRIDEDDFLINKWPFFDEMLEAWNKLD